MRKTSIGPALPLLLACAALILCGCTTRPLGAGTPPSVKDRLAIQDLLARYAHYIDNNLGEAWASTFTADGRLEYFGTVIAGHDQLAAFAGRPRDRYSTHFVGDTLMVQTAPGLVHARSMVMVAVRLKKETPTELLGVPVPSLTELLGVGIYDDQIVKTKDGWRFKLRQAGSTGTAPFHPDFLPPAQSATTNDGK